jgi:catechol 2,3-dioxygenase-like lactoylglutathione lyase family enzyme
MRAMQLFLAMGLMFGSLAASANDAEPVDLGKFSVSLNVQDLKKSIAFYESLGFKQIKGDSVKWAFMQNGTTLIGLFHGLFEGTGLTFNTPDVRTLQKQLKARGVQFDQEAQPGSGPGYAVVKDPDGTVILMEQF